VQTGKTRRMPIILMHAPYWRGMLEWIRERLLGEAMIDAGDVELLQVIDEPRAVVDAIFSYYEKRGFEPSPQEREVLLNL
jgi:predicted Rossmann-fold nucleotide-binding protein